MKIINAGYEIIDKLDGAEILKKIELCGRVCYKSEEKITKESSVDFVKSIIKRGHESVLEHASITVKFICDRGVSHEIVRHRIAGYSQESTRYCNYGKKDEITVIKPHFWQNDTWEYDCWLGAMEYAEKSYLAMIREGFSPQEARSVLPNSLKTEIVMTANLREWRHFFKLRTSPAAHPQMREIAAPLLAELKRQIPVVFEDIKGEPERAGDNG